MPYLGEIRMFAGNFAPTGWAFCDGQFLPIAENEELFQLIGTTYGGDGEETFCLPNLNRRVPIHQGSEYTIGEMGGVEEVTLTVQQIPSHTHAMLASNAFAQESSPGNNLYGRVRGRDAYITGTDTTSLHNFMIGGAGGSQPHSNMQPYLAINFIISLFGIFPTQTLDMLAVNAEPFYAEIRIFPFNFAPRNWAFCNGQIISISQDTALFSLLGTMYGGDGKSTFALPDLRGRVPLHAGANWYDYSVGETGGSTSVTLLPSEMPMHNHLVRANTGFANYPQPAPNSVLARADGDTPYNPQISSSRVDMAFQTLAPTGGGFEHNNMMPYLTLNFCIALQGIFPSRS